MHASTLRTNAYRPKRAVLMLLGVVEVSPLEKVLEVAYMSHLVTHTAV